MGEGNRISVLFNKYTSGTADQEEIKELLELLKSENSANELDGDLEQLWNNLQDAPEEHQVDWDKMYSKTVNTGAEVKVVKLDRRTWLSAAALLVGVLSVAAWFTTHKQPVQEYIAYETAKAEDGKMRIVYLSDGSKVTLNSGTALRYPKTFAGQKREVYLDGEAYFEIAHNAKKSFLVHSGKVVTSVLGTSFNVTAYPKISNLSVTVITGKVAVKDTESQKMVMLLPTERAVLKAGKIDFTVDSVKDAADMIAWTKGELVFTNATLEEIACKIGYKYGISININNREKSGRKITGTFNKQSFLDIMDAITRLTDTQYTLKDQHYNIY
jgi:transmembrane sensor